MRPDANFWTKLPTDGLEYPLRVCVGFVRKDLDSDYVRAQDSPSQGPSKPQLEHLYILENFLHFSHLQINTSWQLGQ